MQTILEVKNLSKTFLVKDKPFKAVDEISFEIYEGECLGIVGESGCGKSTISKMITRLITPDSGEINFLGENISRYNKSQLSKIRSEMQMVFQNPKDSFNPRMKLVDSVSEGLKHNTKLNKKQRREEVKKAFELVGLKEEYLDRSINNISGGECQRAAIARALLLNPKLLICDEITSALDVSVQAQIVSLLYDLKEELKMSYLFITHDLALVSSICDRVMVIYKGCEMEIGTPKEIFENPMHPYTKLLLSCVMTVDEIVEFDIPTYEGEAEDECGCKFKKLCSQRIDKCDNVAPDVGTINGRRVRCHLYK